MENYPLIHLFFMDVPRALRKNLLRIKMKKGSEVLELQVERDFEKETLDVLSIPQEFENEKTLSLTKDLQLRIQSLNGIYSFYILYRASERLMCTVMDSKEKKVTFMKCSNHNLPSVHTDFSNCIMHMDPLFQVEVSITENNQ